MKKVNSKLRLKDNKELMKQLNIEESLKLNEHILNYMMTSREYAIWKCPIHGDYKQRIYYRALGCTGCKLCDKIHKYGNRTTFIINTEHAKDLNMEACNKHNIDIKSIVRSDHKTKLYWNCEHGHIYTKCQQHQNLMVEDVQYVSLDLRIDLIQ